VSPGAQGLTSTDGAALEDERQNPGRRIAAYTTQARAPLFDTAPFELRGRSTAPGRCELWAVTPEGTVAMSAEGELA